MGKKETKAQLELAKAMNRLADNLEMVLDPAWWQRQTGQLFQTFAEIPAVAPVLRANLPAGSLESITVRLSDEEREQMSQMVYEALQPQLHEFQGFVKQSLEELPAHRLKELAKQIEAGEKPRLEKRRGCIYVTFEDGTEQYLGL